MQQTITNAAKLAIKIEQFEKQIFKFKKENIFNFIKIPISLKGILKGINISDKDIERAKKSVFKTVKL
jgi:hypothetical protein